MEFPLGPVSIEFDATKRNPSAGLAKVTINKTLEDQDTLLATTIDTFEVRVDQLSGAYIAQHFAGDDAMVFTCSVMLDTSMLPNLSSAYVKGTSGVAYDPAGKNVLFGELKIHPLASGSSTDNDIFGYKVSCTPTIQGNFKTQDVVRVDLKFAFSGNDDSSTSDGKLFGVLAAFGTYQPK